MQPAQLPINMFSVFLRDCDSSRWRSQVCETAEGNRWQKWNSFFHHPSPHPPLSPSLLVLPLPHSSFLLPSLHYFSFFVSFSFPSFCLPCPFSSLLLMCALTQTFAVTHFHTLLKADTVFFLIFMSLSGAGDSSPQGWIPGWDRPCLSSWKKDEENPDKDSI